MKIDILFYIGAVLTAILVFVSFRETYIHIRMKRNSDYKPTNYIRNFFWKILRHMTIVELQRVKGYTEEDAIEAVDEVGRDWRKDMKSITKDMKKDVNDTIKYIGDYRVHKLVYFIPLFGFLLAIMLRQDNLIKKPLYAFYSVISIFLMVLGIVLMVLGN
jgi:hypothetical protein